MALRSDSIARVGRKVAHLTALIVLTLVILGPAVPIDIAVLMAATLLSVFGMAGSRQVRVSVLYSARARLAEMIARISTHRW